MSGSSRELSAADQETITQVSRSVAAWAAGWSFVQKMMPDVTKEDLFQIAWLGAWRSALRYDRGRGMSFRVWVQHNADYAVRHYVRDHLTTHRGVSRIAYERGVLQKSIFPISLDAPIGTKPDSRSVTESVVGQDDPATEVSARVTLEQILARLPRRWAQLLWSYYGMGFRQVELAQAHGLSQKHISRLLQKGLARAREIVAA